MTALHDKLTVWTLAGLSCEIHTLQSPAWKHSIEAGIGIVCWAIGPIIASLDTTSLQTTT